jgi:hypothetical protein
MSPHIDRERGFGPASRASGWGEPLTADPFDRHEDEAVDAAGVHLLDLPGEEADGMSARVCRWCGRGLEGKRPHARSCGSTCRARASEIRRVLDGHEVQGHRHVQGLMQKRSGAGRVAS